VPCAIFGVSTVTVWRSFDVLDDDSASFANEVPVTAFFGVAVLTSFTTMPFSLAFVDGEGVAAE
jgi:hypothetical protein